MRSLFFCLFAALAAVPLDGEARDATPPPVAARKPVTMTHHGVQLTDDYAWMRTAKPEAVLSKPDLLEPAIKRHLAEEKRYATKLLAPYAALEAQIVAEMKARASVEADTVPETFGPFAYYTRYAPGAERKLHCRRPRDGGPEQILLDENALAGKRRDFSVDETAISPDHKLFAYTFDVDGSERNTLRVRDLATGRDLADMLLDVRGTPIWSTDGAFLFYVRRDPAKWASTVWRHKLGTAPSQDTLVYEEREEGFSVGLSGTLSNRFAFIEIADFSTTQLALIDLAAPEAPPRLLTPRSAGVKFGAADLGDRLIVSTNGDGATTWKVTERPLAGGPETPLADLIPSRPDRLIQSVIVYRQHLVRLERDLEKGQQQIVVRRWADGQEHTIAFPDGPARIEILPGEEQDTTTLRFTYETMAQPRQTFDYDMETRARTLRKVRDVPSGHDPAAYITQRIEATAKDGTKVPVSLLMRKDTPRDGSSALWLLGYGAYGDVDQPEFVPGRLSLVDRGMIYAIAHVRGGGDKGEAWHDAGRLRNKMTTFTDFIAVVEHLIGEGYTSKGKVVGYGASAGGTLMGAVANMRPDLFGAIIAEVPFVDVLNTMLDADLPLTPGEWPEWGNPIEDKAAFELIRSYSPYDNVTAQDYPPMFISGGLNDPRVTYWEPAKWAAKLRSTKTDDNVLLLKTNMGAGHGGKSGRFESLREAAEEHAFVLWQLGISG